MRQLQCNIRKLGYGPHIGKAIVGTFLLFFLFTSVSANITEGTDSINIQDNLGKKTELKKKKTGFVGFLSSLTEIDTTYIRPNMYNMQGMVYSDMMFNIYKISGTDENGGNNQSLYFSPYSTLHVGPYVAYSFSFLGYSFNLGRKETSSGRSNMYLSIYSPIIGIDFYYQKGTNNYRLTRASGFSSEESKKIHKLQFSGIDTYLQNINAYYVFRHKKFSYTAAYSQSGQQLRSAGSFMLGFSYARQKLKFDYTQLPLYLIYDGANEVINNALKVNNIDYRNYSISLGYSYNWVFVRNMLFNITLTPSIGYNVNQGEQLEFNKDLFKYTNINFDLTGRNAIVWNSGKFFAGVSTVVHTYSHRKSNFSVLNALFKINMYAGVSFWKRKAYKKKKS